MLMTAGEWMSTKDACGALGVTLRTLYRFIDVGDLPAYKMGRVIRLRRGEVQQFIARAKMQPGDIGAAHKYVEKGAYRRPAADVTEMQIRLDAFIAGYRDSEPAPCMFCGVLLAPIEVAQHLL